MILSCNMKFIHNLRAEKYVMCDGITDVNCLCNDVSIDSHTSHDRNKDTTYYIHATILQITLLSEYTQHKYGHTCETCF
jgi:hypothetical protein